MTDQSQPPIDPQPETPVFFRLIRPRNLIIVSAAIGVLVVIGFIIAFIGALINPDGFGNFFRILRDFFIIVLALQGILISTALVILVIQVSALVSLLREEISPIVKETRETLATVRGTATFVSQNVTQPVIRTAAFVAGTRRLLADLSGVRRNTRGHK